MTLYLPTYSTYRHQFFFPSIALIVGWFKTVLGIIRFISSPQEKLSGAIGVQSKKTKVPWRPSWISRWPSKIQSWKCVHWICWPRKHMCRHQNHVSMTSSSWYMNNLICGHPYVAKFKFRWGVPSMCYKTNFGQLFFRQQSGFMVSTYLAIILNNKTFLRKPFF